MKLDHMVILLTNVAEGIRFYDALLPMIGFEKLREHVFANRDGVHLDFRAAGEPEHPYRRYAPGLNHLGFTATDRTSLEDIRTGMSRAGFDAPAIQHFDDGDAIFFRDSEGMRIEVGYYS